MFQAVCVSSRGSTRSFRSANEVVFVCSFIFARDGEMERWRDGEIISVAWLPRSLRSLALSASRTVFKSDPRNQRAGPAAQDRPFDGRGGGIRTHETLRPAGFQDQCIQPLCHPSRFFENGISKSGTIGEARDSFNPVLSPCDIFVSDPRIQLEDLA